VSRFAIEQRPPRTVAAEQAKVPAGHGVGRSIRPLICVGQISVDTVILTAGPLSVGDQVCGQYRQALGGSAAITAHNAAILGAAASLAGFAGASPDDTAALESLANVGVDLARVLLGEGLRVTVLVEPNGERTMISNNVSGEWEHVMLHVAEGDIVYFEGWPLFDPVRRASYVKLIETAAASGATVALDVCSASRGDPNAHRRLLMRLPLDFVFANEREAAHYGLLGGGLPAVSIVHRGPEPTVVVHGHDATEVPSHPADPLDTTGAGDTFAAGFLSALASGAGLVDAVNSGHDAAFQVLTTIGPLLASDPAQNDRNQRIVA
jgi:sugar/nucleoside kinase (ribokinase family)